MRARLTAQWSPHWMPIKIHPGELSFTNEPLDEFREEQDSVIPIVPLPNGEKRTVEICVLEVPNKIVFTNNVPVRFRDFHTDSIILNHIDPRDGIPI